MRILYLSLEMGAAGDMLSAALYELLTDEQKKDYLKKINDLGIDGVHVNAEASEKCGITGTHMSVLIDGAEEPPADTEDGGSTELHSHAHEHGHHHSSLRHVNETILLMDLPEAVKEDALQVYDLLARAESHAHGVDITEIHFHEVGEKDAIVDVVSVSLLMNMLRPDRVAVSPVATGSGTVRCAHGILPVPAPATAYILQMAKIPCYPGPEECELLTPTGAALLGYFADEFGKMPAMTILGTGYGMGKKEFREANCVRAILGESSEDGRCQVPKEDGRCQVPVKDTAVPHEIGLCGGYDGCQAPADMQEEGQDMVSELSCNLDDMTPEDIAYACGQLFAAGALDVFTTAIGMKKNRPGTMLTALCHEDRKKAVVKAFFRYTTTLGVREKVCRRYIMKSEKESISLGEGGNADKIDIKISAGYGEKRVKPEFDQIAEAARKQGLSTAKIREQILSRGGRNH